MLTPRTPAIGTHGGYDAVTDNEGTQVTTICLPSQYFKRLPPSVNAGLLRTGDVAILLKYSEVVNEDTKVTWDSHTYRVINLKPIYFVSVLIAYRVELRKEISG